MMSLKDFPTIKIISCKCLLDCRWCASKVPDCQSVQVLIRQLDFKAQIDIHRMCLNFFMSKVFLLLWMGVVDCQTQQNFVMLYNETDQCALSTAMDFPWFLGCSAAWRWAKPHQMIVLLGWYEALSYVMLPKMFCRCQKWSIAPILAERYWPAYLMIVLTGWYETRCSTPGKSGW